MRVFYVEEFFSISAKAKYLIAGWICKVNHGGCLTIDTCDSKILGFLLGRTSTLVTFENAMVAN